MGFVSMIFSFFFPAKPLAEAKPEPEPEIKRNAFFHALSHSTHTPRANVTRSSRVTGSSRFETRARAAANSSAAIMAKTHAVIRASPFYQDAAPTVQNSEKFRTFLDICAQDIDMDLGTATIMTRALSMIKPFINRKYNLRESQGKFCLLQTSLPFTNTFPQISA